MFLRANSFTVSGLKSNITATCLLFNSSSSLSVMEPLPEAALQSPSAGKKFFLSNKFTKGCQGNYASIMHQQAITYHSVAAAGDRSRAKKLRLGLLK
jgi:hypothetical protein